MISPAYYVLGQQKCMRICFSTFKDPDQPKP